MSSFSFEKPEAEKGYAFKKPEVKRLAERMVRISRQDHNWDNLVGFALEFKELVDKYGPRDKDLHEGIFQTLARVKDDIWSAAFNFLIHVLVHPGVKSSFLNNPQASHWAKEFLEPEKIENAAQELRQNLGV